MPRVLAFGTFDPLHPGHEFFLRRAAEEGDLTVAVARDAHIRTLKNREPHREEAERLAVVCELPFVAHARLADEALGTYQVIRDVQPDVIALGFDQTALADDLRRWMNETRWPIKLVCLSETP